MSEPKRKAHLIADDADILSMLLDVVKATQHIRHSIGILAVDVNMKPVRQEPFISAMNESGLALEGVVKNVKVLLEKYASSSSHE